MGKLLVTKKSYGLRAQLVVKNLNTLIQSFRPFCSERCQLIDLGRWLEGDYAIPSDPSEEKIDEESGEE